MKALKHVNLASNRLSRSIPFSIGIITSLEFLDMSNNQLNGMIPEEMSQLNSLRELNVSYNHLCGKIPEGKPFNSFRASAFDHNNCLCGSPLPPCHSIGGTLHLIESNFVKSKWYIMKFLMVVDDTMNFNGGMACKVSRVIAPFLLIDQNYIGFGIYLDVLVYATAWWFQQRTNVSIKNKH